MCCEFIVLFHFQTADERSATAESVIAKKKLIVSAVGEAEEEEELEDDQIAAKRAKLA